MRKSFTSCNPFKSLVRYALENRLNLKRACDPSPPLLTEEGMAPFSALPRFAPGLWKEISLLSPQSMLHFVPSHGKNQNWRPPGQHSASVWRHLNSLADAKANSIAHRDFQHLKTFCDDFDIAANWSHLALTRQMQIIAAFEQQLSTQTTLS